jgi:hypothetical protein
VSCTRTVRRIPADGGVQRGDVAAASRASYVVEVAEQRAVEHAYIEPEAGAIGSATDAWRDRRPISIATRLRGCAVKRIG